ncbi:MAG: integration host factor subunit beta [Syntrophales bacterium]|nr:integration host factor subunit beta [Syntrophales bacterium]
MNRSDLIKTLAAKEDLTERKAKEVISLIFEGFRDSLKSCGTMEVRGFGRFSVRDYGPYTGRNPRTGENVEVAPKKLPHFKVGKELREIVDGE